MRRIGTTSAVLVASFAMSVFATAPAFALPDASISLGGAYPLHLQGSLGSSSTTVGTASGSALEGQGFTLLVLTKELTSLGEFAATFTKIHVPGKPTELCNTTGDATGAVLITGIFHLVLTSKPEQLASLFLIKETEIICPKIELAVKGSVISTLSAGTEKEELTKLGGKLTGTNGKQELTEYINDSGTVSKSQLLLNAGVGFVLANQNIGEEVKLEALEGKMFIITSR